MEDLPLEWHEVRRLGMQLYGAYTVMFERVMFNASELPKIRVKLFRTRLASTTTPRELIAVFTDAEEARVMLSLLYSTLLDDMKLLGER
jgi:hypothetical protein